MTLKFTRVWAMPNSETFKVPPIGEFVLSYLRKSKVSVDPFARNCNWATCTNDLNPNTIAQYHMEALDFLKMLREKGIKADLVIFDPPYSAAQIKLSYEGIGLKLMESDVYKTAGWKLEKDVVNDILEIGGVFLHFGWHTNGMGKGRGYEEIELLNLYHGAAHLDTLCLAERKMFHQTSLFWS